VASGSSASGLSQIGAAERPSAAGRTWPFDWQMSPPRVVLAIVGTICCLLVVPPLLFLAYTSFVLQRRLQFVGYTLDNYRGVFESITASLVLNTLVFAIGSSLIAVVVGATTAWLTERTNAHFRRAAFVGALLTLSIPLIVKIIGWILLAGPQAGAITGLLKWLLRTEQLPFELFSLGGMTLLEGFLWSPIAFLLALGPLRAMDPSLEEAAAMSGASVLETIRRVTLPMMRPAMLSIVMLAFIRALEAFDVPLLIGQPAGVNLLTTNIYRSIRSGLFPTYGEASAFAVLLTVLIALALIPYYRVVRDAKRFATITGKGFRPRQIDLGRWRWPASLLLLVMPSFLIAPVVILFWASLLPFYQAPSLGALSQVSLRNYVFALAYPNIQMGSINSLIAALSTATIIALLALLAAWAIARSGSRFGAVVDFVASLPLIFPGIVLGLAILQIFLLTPNPIYGSVWIIVLAYTIAFLPYGMRYSHPAVLAIHSELEEAAHVAGAGTLTILRRIVLPLVLPALAALWIYIVLTTARELSLAVLLAAPQSQVIAVVILEMWTSGNINVLAAFSCLLIVFLTSLAIIFQRLALRFGFHG
jgi:iron(III) transport system permease protein